MPGKFERRRRRVRQQWVEPAERDWCVRRLQHDHVLPLGSLTYRQAALVIALLSTVFALLIGGHEIIVEGFDVRNFVAIAFCVVWFIVDNILILGVYRRTSFLLLPWLVLIAALTPLFVVAIVFGAYAVHECIQTTTVQRNDLSPGCLHEYHTLGTSDHVTASLKLAVLSIILLTNMLSALFIYQFYRTLSTSSLNIISPTVGSLAETTLSCEFQQQQQQHPHLGDDDVSCDDDDELCYSGALVDGDQGLVDVPMSRPLVADRRRQPGVAAATPSDPASSARTHCCFNQHAIVANR